MSTAFFRTLILYFLIMAGLRLTGKRQIGELEPGELVLTMMISDLAAVPMQDFGIPLLARGHPHSDAAGPVAAPQPALPPVLSASGSSSAARPTVLIRNGKLQQAAMRKNRFTIDERAGGAPRPGRTAALTHGEVRRAGELNGQVSFLPLDSGAAPHGQTAGPVPGQR